MSQREFSNDNLPRHQLIISDEWIFKGRTTSDIQPFAIFYITRAANSIQIGNSSYTSLLMRPSDEMSIALNVEREIIVLFSDYETFEARTLQAFDKTFEQIDDVRIDRSVRVLISRDPHIQQRIQHYLLQNPEYPIVLPMRYSDLLSNKPGFILQAIRQNFLVRDLFGYQSPLKQEYFFFGRGNLINSTLDLHRSGQNSGLFGLRKSGKTSTIYAVQRRAKTAGCRTCVIDCQNPAVHAKRYNMLLEKLISDIRKELGQKSVVSSLGDAPDEVSEKFQRLMNQTLNDAQCDVLLIFDEIENISPKTAASKHWRDANDSLLFWQTLRAYSQQAARRKLTFCFVGTNPHLFEMPKLNDVDNPVYLFAPRMFIPMLSLSETKEMITRLGYFMGLDFGDDLIARLHSKYGGHAFFIRQICSQIHKNTPLDRPRAISLASCRAAEEKSLTEVQSYFTEILSTLQEFYPDEYSMLEYLVRGDSAAFQEMADYSVAYVEHLIGYGLLIRRGDELEFAFEAVEEALKRQVQQTNGGMTERWAEANRRRNNLEQEIRTFLFRWSRTLTNEDWEKYLTEALNRERLTRFGSIARNHAFGRRNSPLYLIELLSFLKRCDAAQFGDVDASVVYEAMHAVNRLRNDAHASDISAEDFSILVAAFELLEGVFLPPM